MLRSLLVLMMIVTSSPYAIASSVGGEESGAENIFTDVKTLKCVQALKGTEKKDAYLQYAEPRPANKIEKAIVLADWGLVTWLSVKASLGMIQDPGQLLVAGALVVPTLVVADFMGQVFHKLLDSYTSENNPIWGNATRRFRQHHEVPSNLDRTDYLSNVSSFAVILAPAFVAAHAVDMGPAYQASVALLLVTLMNATEFHKQAHMKDPNAFFRLMQKLRLGLSHEQHMRHHRPPFDSEFTVINGWSEPIAKHTDLWNRMDRIWWKAFRRLPNHWIQDPRAIPPQIVQELIEDVGKIPPELIAYSELNPSRLPPELREVIEKVNAEIEKAAGE